MAENTRKSAKGTGSWTVRDARTGTFVVETFPSKSAEAGAKLASGKESSPSSKSDYGRLLRQDVQDYGGYILSKRLNRHTATKK